MQRERRFLGLASGLALLTTFLLTSTAHPDLVTHLPLNGNLDDAGPGGNNGSIHGGAAATYTEGVDGTVDGAILFAGVDEPIVLLQNTFLPLSNQPAFSIAMWVQGPTPTSGPDVNLDDRVFSEGSTTSNTPLFNIGTANAAGNPGVDFFLRGDTSGTVVNHLKSARPAFDDSWHHIAWVDDNGTVSLYVDGVLDSVDFNYARAVLTADTTTIGGILRAAPCCSFTGAIDDVRIYDHLLTQEEVRALVGPDCPADSDTTCDGLVVDGPGGVGIYTLTASATDTSGDTELLYTFSATNADDGATLNAGPQSSNTTDFSLGVGTWTLAVEIDDNPFCFDVDAGNSCSEELIIDPPPALISHYAFDGDLIDSVGTNDGDYMGLGAGPTFGPGFDGTADGAVCFDATLEDLVVLQQNSGLPISLNEAFSIAMWVQGVAPRVADPENPDDVDVNRDDRIFSEASTTDNSPLYNIGTHPQAADGSLDLFVRNDSGAGTPLGHSLSDRPAIDDTWHHIAVVDDNGVLTVYIDGVRDANDYEYTRGSLTANTTTLGGILRGGPCCWFSGCIDDARLYNYALSAEEVDALVPDRPDCPEVGDTHCEGLEVTSSPEGDVAGEWTFTATGTDDGLDSPPAADGAAAGIIGDPVLYTFVATNGDGARMQAGPSTDNAATFTLLPGDWTVTVSVDDDLFCSDAAGDNSCVLQQTVLSEPEELLAAFDFDGDLVESVSGLEATFVGAEGVPFADGIDCVGGAIAFDGTDDLVQMQIPGVTPVSQRAAFSVAMWVRGAVENDRRVFSESNTQGNNNALFNIGTHNAGADGTVNLFVRNDGGTQLAAHLHGSLTAFDGSWHHIAYTDVNGQVALYVDGVLDPADLNYTREAMTLDTTTIGGILRESSCCHFPGDIDDVRIYNYALDADEVAAIIGDGATESCCPEEGDTHCTGLAVEGPDGDGPGTWTATASAVDDSGDTELSYVFEASDGLGTVLSVGPQAENVADFELTEGNWTISVVVDDDPECDDAAGDNGCSREISVQEPGVGPFTRGDVDVNGARELTDAVVIFGFLFTGGRDPECFAAADTNLQGEINVTSGIYLLNWLFQGGTAPPAPMSCGFSNEASDIALGCEVPCTP